MPDFNDVVRHVILRIIVDQGGLAEELAAARTKLKELEKSEHDSNSNRAKDFDRVTERIDKQTEAVRRNAKANEAQASTASKGARGVADDWEAATKATEAATKANLNQARIQRENNRSEANTAAKIARDKEALDTKLFGQRLKNAQAAYTEEHTRNQRLLKDLDEIAAARAKSQQSIATSGYATDKAAHEATKSSYLSDTAGSVADKEFARSRDAADLTERNIADRRARSLQDARRARVELNNLSAKGNVLEQQALSIAERRAMAEERFVRTRRRGLAGGIQSAGGAIGDLATGARRAVQSAPASFRRGQREYDLTPEIRTLSNSMADLRKEATGGERIIASFFGVFRRDSNSALTSTSRLRDAFRSYGRDVRTLAGQPNPFQAFARSASEASGVFGKARAGISGFFGAAKKDGADGERVVRGFFGRFRTDSEGAVRSIQRVSAGFKEFLRDINRARSGGSGGSLFESLVRNASSAANSLGTVFDGMGKRFLSIRTLIVVVIAAFGPLSAILGGVGAAALGLASNLVALSGSLLAIPGLVVAAASAFGVLALVMKPLTGVFQAYTASQKAAAKGTVEGSKAAVTAANALVDAQRRLSDATLAHQRAVEDAPRAEQRLTDARKDAARSIQDYRIALQRLKFDQEGAELGAKSALRDYRRALADPTASTLDKQIARHAYEGSLNNKQDQAIQAGRTQQDAAEAFKKGIEGADAVVDALRGVVDAQRAITDSLLAEKRAREDVTNATKDQKAGGSAARAALEAYQAELAKLGPKTRKVAEAVIGLSDSFKDMRKRLSDRVFGPISDDTGKFAGVLKSLEQFLGPTADAIGILADKALKLFTNPDWKRFFEVQGIESGKTIRKLGDALLAAADGFKNIIEISRPFVQYVVGGILGLAKSFEAFTSSEEGRKKIGDFLKNTQKRMGELKGIVSDLIAGFAGFFAALNTSGGGKEDFTTYFNKGLAGAAASFKELGDKARDPNGGFQTWLRNVRPLLGKIVDFLSSAGKFFGNLFSNPANLKEASSLLEAISTKWLPKLAEIFDSLSKSGLISKLASGIGTAFGAIQKFLENGGVEAISSFATSVENTIGFVSGLVTAFSAIPGVLQTIGAALALVFGAAFFTKFTGINAVVKGTFGLLKGLVNLRDSINNPLNDPKNDPTHPDHPDNKNKPKPSTGGIGPVGSDDPTHPNNKPGKPKRRLGGLLPPKKPAKTKPTKKPGIFGTILNGLTGSPSTSTVGGAIKGQVLGDNSTESILKRSERYLRQIEINTRRTGGGSSGGIDVDNDPDDRRNGKNKPGGTDDTTSRNNKGGKGARPGRRGGIASTFADDVRDGVDPRGPLRPGSSQTTAYGPQETMQERDRRLANEREETRRARNSPTGRQARLDAVADAQTRRLDGGTVPRLDPEPRFRSTVPPAPVPVDRRERTTEPAQVDTQPNNRRDATTETNAQKRKRLARERAEARNAKLNTPKPKPTPTVTVPDEPDVDEPEPTKAPKRNSQSQVPSRPTDISGAPIADVGDDRTPYTRVGHDEPYHVPTAAETGGKAPSPPRGPGGRITSPYTGEPGLGFPEPNFPGQQPPAKDTPRRNPQTRNPQGQFGPRVQPTPVGSGLPDLPVLADVGKEKPRPSRLRRIGNALLPQGDSGSFSPTFGIGAGDDDSDTKTHPNSRRFGKKKPKSSRRPKRHYNTPNLPGGAGGDDDYDEGYDDGLNANRRGGGGGDDGQGSGTSDLTDLLDGLDGDDDDDDTNKKHGTDDDDDGKKKPTRKERREARRQSRESRRGTSGGRRGLGGARRGLGGAARRLGGLGGRLGGLGKGIASRFGGGLAGRLGGGLLRGAAGGIGGLVAGAAASLGGDYLIDKFVKNDDDASSLQRGLGAVSTGAGIGATIGSIIPGFGTVVGGAVGGAIGGAYSLIKDANLRRFVGGKLSSGAKAVGGALSGAGKAVGGFFGGVGSSIAGLFGGGKDDDKPGGGINVKGLLGGALLGPLGALIGGTGIGGKILDSLKKAGGGIAGFFTKTIPDAFRKGMKVISDFFTKTLPSLPRKAFQSFVEALGAVVGFFQYKIPAAAEAAWAGITHFFTETLPNVASAAWAGITGFFTETLPNVASAAWAGITTFFTETLPNVAGMAWAGITGFFTETLPNVASAAWDGITHFFSDTLPNVFNTVVDSISTFFSVTLPNFFTVTLPDAISKVPGAIKAAIVDPVVNFFSGIKDHIGDIAKGSWDWIKSIFSGAGDSFNKGKDSQKPGMMSGGLIQGIYQGIEDKASIRVTPGEWVVRRSKVEQPQGKRFLSDYNEGRINPADFYGGLSASAAPQVMSLVPPDARAMAGAAPAVVNNTVNHAPLMGDVTIHNPVREASERSLRRQVEIAAIRHRR